jgi:Ca2+-binding EF-hand superfamily protein
MGCVASSNEATLVVPANSLSKTAKNSIPLQTGHPIQAAALHALFAKHDRKARNQLTATDLATLYIDMTMSNGKKGITQKDINAVMEFIDSDGSGGISRGEFLEWIESGFTKKASQLKKFARKGHIESLLVDFLVGVIGHTHNWITSFQSLFRGNEDGVTESNLWITLQRNMTRAQSYKNSATGDNAPPLKSILTLSSKKSNSLIVPQDACDFIVHMSLHSKYRPHTVTLKQKEVYQTILATIEAGMTEKKTSAKTVASNPLIVLACSAMFSTYDTSGDDVLDGAEIKRLLNSICSDTANGEPPQRDEIQELTQLLDVDNDGMLSREEFINAVLSMMQKEDQGIVLGRPKLAGKLEIGVVNLARQLERRRIMLHRLHKKYAKKETATLNQDGLFRLLRHCQKKQKIELRDRNAESGDNIKSNIAKVTDVAVEAVMSVFQAASKTAVTVSSTQDGTSNKNEITLAPTIFSGPILLSSCMHPAQINKQRMLSKNMNLVLDMYELINTEVGRMVREGDVRRIKKRNASNMNRTNDSKGVKKNDNDYDDDDDDDDEDNDDDSDDDDFGGGEFGYRNGGNEKVDFGW